MPRLLVAQRPEHQLSPTLKGHAMTDQEIRDLYDASPDMTLRELSALTGRSIRELKQILLQ